MRHHTIYAVDASTKRASFTMLLGIINSEAKGRCDLDFLPVLQSLFVRLGVNMCSLILMKCRYCRLRLSPLDHAVEFHPVAFTTGAGSVAPHCACAYNGLDNIIYHLKIVLLLKCHVYVLLINMSTKTL